jgi:hypothetical protein
MKKTLITLWVLITMVIMSGATFAAYTIPQEFAPSNTPFANNFDPKSDPTGNANIVLQTLASALLYFAAPVTIAMLVFTGIGMIMGGADSEKQEAGKKQVQWALLGLLAIMLSYSIVRAAIFFALSSVQQPAPPMG